MKRNLLLFLLVMSSMALFSQNWSPINTSEKFCYSSDDTLDIINNVLWVNSFEQIGDDQVFHLNKIALEHDGGDGNVSLLGQPQFLLDDINIHPDGHWTFVDTFPLPIEEFETFSIYPNAQLDDVWDFESGLTATITDMFIMNFLGESDSVKVITLSDDTEILLSKDHGILNWRNDYQLIGIEGRDIGILVPDFDDMFTKISAGDVICFDKGRWQADETVTGWHGNYRYDIEAVTRYEDSIVIYAYIRSYVYNFWKKQAEMIDGYGNIVLKRNRFTDVYPNDTVRISDYNYAPLEGILISKLGKHKWGGIKKTQLVFETEWFQKVSLLNECEGLYGDYLCIGDFDSDHLLMEHSVDYGFLEYYDAGFEWGGEETLTGIIDDGDTLGTIYPIDFFVGNQELTIQSNWQFYPNPAQDFLNIISSNLGAVEYQIYHITGQLMEQKKIRKVGPDLSIDISHLAKGAYMINLLSEGESVQEKFIKQ